MKTLARAGISMPGQRYSSLKKNTHAGAGISIYMPGQGYTLPPGGYPCLGMEIHARASIVLD